MSSHHHRSTGLHQSNKPHKSKFASNGAATVKNKGKVERAGDRLRLKQLGKDPTKTDRRNRGKQILHNKREEALKAKRLGTSGNPPKIVGIVSMGPGLSSEEIFEDLKSEGELCGGEHDAKSRIASTVSYGTWKQRITLVKASRTVQSVLDVAKIADLLVLVVPSEGVDDLGEQFISLLKAQGLPAVIGVTKGLSSLQVKNKKEKKRDLRKWFSSQFVDEPKLLPMDNKQEIVQVIRFLSSTKLKTIAWREVRPYLFADNIQYQEDPSGNGTLSVSGFLRGRSINVNNLVHIPNWGDFQLKQIDGVPDPYLLSKKGMDMESEQVQTLAVPDPSIQETLVTENEPDLFENEQTWPTHEELLEAENQAHKEVKKKRVPKGTSAYQAAWIIESDDDSGQSDEEEDEMHDEKQSESEEEEMVEMEDDMNSVVSEDILALEREAEKQQSEEIKRTKEEESAEDLEWPDEVNTPKDTPARIRFQKYRGLKSFRTSPWDVKENLPREYGRIFQFQSYTRAKNRVMASNSLEIDPGQYITIHVANVSKELWETYDPSSPFVVGGLLMYENKTSVVHFTIMKHASYTKPVKSKELLEFHVGLRKYTANPIFSDANVNRDKHKYERFLHANRSTVASVYAPITFPPAPILIFKAGTTQLVAVGSLQKVNPDRVIVKKIILTGYPLKIHKRNAVLRHMFYDPNDVKWFKPVELWTKYGRTGHIRDSLGTHGLMKCIFDGPLTARDTICMSLYKRVFPVYGTRPDKESDEAEPETKEEEMAETELNLTEID